MISAISISAYVIFGVFVFCQQLHVKNFAGSSQSFAMALNVSAFSGMLVGLGFLIFCFMNFHWWTPIAVFSIGLLAKLPFFLIERIISPLTLSLAGFVIWPIAAYAMFAFA